MNTQYISTLHMEAGDYAIVCDSVQTVTVCMSVCMCIVWQCVCHCVTVCMSVYV